jgi:homoisocitrate dehydrogenase
MPQLCVIPGDGIGLEVIPAAVKVLRAVLPDLETVEADAGWACFEKQGVSVPQETLKIIRACGAALFGAVSSPSRKVEGYRSAILTLRQALDLYANLRPVRSLPHISPAQGIDFMVVRENTEGLYVQRERREGDTAIAERVITKDASARIGLVALELAARRALAKMTIVHKANILPVTDGLFRDTVREVAAAYPGVQVDELLVDIACLKVVSEPQRFEVIVTTNLFGDILSDVASYWAGGMGYAPSINIGRDAVLAEPVHGSAPDIAGQGIANPIAAILSAALLLRHAWQKEASAVQIEGAVEKFLEESGQEVLAGKLGTDAITEGVMKHLS